MGLTTTTAGDGAMVARLRAKDPAAYAELVDRYQDRLLRVALDHVKDRASAQEVVQDTWIAVFEGIDRFEERCSLRSWLFRILGNRARTRGLRESRTRPMSSLGPADATKHAALAPRCLQAEHYWQQPARPWHEDPERQILRQELRQQLEGAIERLPVRQRKVMELRDVQGWTGGEVCDRLSLSQTNQRVLLHRARARVRTELDLAA